MALQLKLPENDRALIAVLVVLYLLTRIPFLMCLPLTQDEAVYAIMSEEQADAPSFIPTFLGHQVSWKPPLLFWVHAAFSKLFSGVLPLELAYRLPSLIFGLATIPPLYLLLRNVGGDKNAAFLAMAIFLCSSTTIYPNDAILTDTLAFLFICSSLWLYTEKRFGENRFIACAALAAAAFFTKLVIAFMVPVLAVAYFWLRNERETLMRPLFLLSLLAVPASFVAWFAILQAAGLGAEAYFSDVGGQVTNPQTLADPGLTPFVAAMNILLASPGIWLVPALLGLWWCWKENRLIALWFLFIALPLYSSYFRPWYYLPVMAPVAWFAAMAISRMGKGWLPKATFAMLAAFSLAACLLMYAIAYAPSQAQKDAGLFLAGKGDAAVIGNYAPGIIAYKTITERRAMGKPLDFGWVLTPPGFTDVREFWDYRSNKYPVSDGSFSGIFTSSGIFRKDTNITEFSWFAMVGQNQQGMPPGEQAFNSSSVRIYRKI